MKIGLYGYEGSGATTLFNAITGQEVATGFSSGGKVHIGTVKVKDPRIDKLSELYKPKKTIYSELIFTDFPGGGKENKTKNLANIEGVKALDILALVIGAFTSEFDDKPKNPASELDDLLTELILLDLEQVERFFERNKKIKSSTLNPFVLSAMNKMKPHLEQGLSLRTLDLSKEELQHLRGFSFITLKPALIAINVNEDKLKEGIPDDIKEITSKHKAEPFLLSAKLEEEISKLDADEQNMFLEDLGLNEPVSTRFIRAAYKLAGLISFFTVGPDEVRSWAIKKNTPAKQAAGTIHSDLEKGFIRAEVFHYDDIIATNGNEGLIKKQGKFRLEGKEYIVKDGDIMHVRFNV